MRQALLAVTVVAMAACEPARGTVTVTSFASGEPTEGAKVIFADRDGDARVSYIDASGRAEGEVEPGGSVWLAWYVFEQRGVNLFAAYLDVQPGELTFGAPPSAATPEVVARMSVTGAPAPAGNAVRPYSACGRFAGENLFDPAIAFDERCNGTADVLVVALQLSGAGDRMTHYAWLRAQPVVDGGTIVVAAADWRPVDQVSIRVGVPGDGDVLAANTYLGVSNGLVAALRVDAIDGDVWTWSIPLIGDELRFGGEIKRDVYTAPQLFSMRVPAVTSQDVDLAGVLAPWTARDVGSGRWSTDNVGGSLTANAMVLEHSWDQPIANFVEPNHLRLMSTPAPFSDFEVPQLPEELDRHQPGDDFLVVTVPRLVRVGGADAAQAQRWAEMVTNGAGNGLWMIGEIPGPFAITLEN